MSSSMNAIFLSHMEGVTSHVDPCCRGKILSCLDKNVYSSHSDAGELPWIGGEFSPLDRTDQSLPE